MVKIKINDIDNVFAAVSDTQTLYIPTDNDKGGASFKKYEKGMALTDKLNSDRSAKDFFFPQMENLYDVKVNGKTFDIIDTRAENEDFVIFGVRACDARSFEILDKVFLTDPVDTYYQNRREHATVITLACNRPEETCFCQSFGINPAEPEGDASAWIYNDNLYIKANNHKGDNVLALLGSISEKCDDSELDEYKKSIENIMSKLPLGKLKFEHKELLDLFNSDKWDSLSEACLGCGTCTFVCPTCQCYDIREFNTGNTVKKFRCWDSCMYSDFTKMAHGNPRTSQKERFRQRFMHKLVYFPENNDGEFGCVGCGRCLIKCPISMNIVKVAKSMEVVNNE